MYAMNKVARKMLFFEGIYYSIKMSRSAYNSLVGTLCKLTDLQSQVLAFGQAAGVRIMVKN